LIAYLIDGGLEDSEREYKLFLEAKEKPQLKKGIINRIMEMNDLELGLKFFSGEIK